MAKCIARRSSYWDLNSKKKPHIIENSGLKICITYLKQSALDKQTSDLYDATVLKKSKGVDNSTKAPMWYTHGNMYARGNISHHPECCKS